MSIDRERFWQIYILEFLPVVSHREVLIYEPSAGGHQMQYVDLFAREIASAGLGPARLVTTNDALNHESTQMVISSGAISSVGIVDDNPTTIPFIYRFYVPAARQYHDTMRLARYTRAEGFNKFRLILIPFLDSSSIIPLAVGQYPFGCLPFSGLVIRPTYHQREQGIRASWRLKELPERFIYKKLFANPKLVGLLAIDPYFVKYHADKCVAYAPDPAEFSGRPISGAMRHHLGISKDAIVILVYGHIDHRKGLAQLVRAVARLGPKSNVVILACGRQDPAAARALPKPELDKLRRRGAFVELDRYISSEEEHAAFRSADIVWVCYGNEYANSSGAMIRAGQASKPIITSHYGLTSQMVKDDNVGLAADAENIEDISATILRLSSDPALRTLLGSNGQRIFSQHTPKAFTAPLIALLQRQLKIEAQSDSCDRLIANVPVP